MKTICIAAICIVVLIGNVFSQSKKERDPVACAVAPARLNVVYLGLENPIKVAVSGVKASSLEVTAIGASIKSGEKPGEYIVHSIEKGVRNVDVVLKSKGKEIGVETFIVKTFPPPEFLLNYKTSGDRASIDEIINSEVIARIEQFTVFEIKNPYTILSFEIAIEVPGGIPQQFVIEGNKIADNPKAAEMVRANLKPGQVFSFKNFKITSPSGVWDNVPGISYLVVE